MRPPPNTFVRFLVLNKSIVSSELNCENPASFNKVETTTRQVFKVLTLIYRGKIAIVWANARPPIAMVDVMDESGLSRS